VTDELVLSSDANRMRFEEGERYVYRKNAARLERALMPDHESPDVLKTPYLPAYVLPIKTVTVRTPLDTEGEEPTEGGPLEVPNASQGIIVLCMCICNCLNS